MRLVNEVSREAEKQRILKRIPEIYKDILNGNYLSSLEYELLLETTRNERMAWWREARFGVFIHYTVSAETFRGEWSLAWDGIPPKEYANLVENCAYESGSAREWVRLAKQAGAKYMVLVTRHHDGFSFWDSKINPYNSVNFGPRIDIVREYVNACREFGMKIGFYSTIMDWHNPDSGNSDRDLEARKRFFEYTCKLNEELLTNYGKIDILWYDMNFPGGTDMWKIMNQRLRAIQPHIIINNRACAEDFGTPEGRLESSNRDWETCETLTDLSWSYIDAEQARPYMKSPQVLINHLAYAARNRGNLLVNIGPQANGKISEIERNIFLEIGAWLQKNGEAVYGDRTACCGLGGDTSYGIYGGNMQSVATAKDNKVYLIQNILSKDGIIYIAGYAEKPKRIYLLSTNEDLSFTYDNFRIKVLLPKRQYVLNKPVVVLEFEKEIPEYRFCGGYADVCEGSKLYEP